jgi:PBSX family phage portal protein
MTVKTRVVKSKGKGLTETSKQIYDDEFDGSYQDDIIAPPYNLRELKKMAEYSTILRQCVDAYKTNIVGFGFGVEYGFDYNADDVSITDKEIARKQWMQLEEFIQYLHYDETTKTIFGYMLDDRESTGNGYLEVVRDGLKRPAGIEHMAAENVRVCKKEEKPYEFEMRILKNGEFVSVKRRRRFRKYVQMINGQMVYFKEYGDPRTMDNTTGEYKENVSEEKQATEVLHFKLGSGPYGVPRWIGHLINMYGARKAEELNYMYFLNGRHVPAAILVEGGMLTADTIKRLQEYSEEVRGTENSHKWLIIETYAESDGNEVDGYDENANVKVELKSLAEMVQEDALFLEYDEKHRTKLRSAFRLPPLYTGEADEYNKATADTARKITEEQVFQPERESIVGKLNRVFLPDLELNKVQLRLKGPDFRDPFEVAKAIASLIRGNAVSPNDLRDLAGQVLGKDLDEWTEEEYNRPLKVNQQGVPLSEIEKSKKKAGQQSDIVTILKDIRDYLQRTTSYDKR